MRAKSTAKRQGGEREGAGRPAIDPALVKKPRTVYLNDEQDALFRELGASSYLRKLLDLRLKKKR